jgi:hypothetical protein
VNHLLDNLPETLNKTGFLQSLVVLAIVGLAFGKVIALTARDEQAKQFEMLLFVTAVAVRFLASLLVYEFGMMEIIKDEDAYGWMGGVVLQGDWVRRDVGIFGVLYECSTPFFHPLGNYGYEYLIGLVFYLTNLPARLPAAVLSNVCGAATAVVVYRVGALLFSEWVARRAAWWTCLMPSLIIWAAQTIKEPIVILLEAVCLYACLQLRRSGFSVARVALCGAVVILLVAFRFYAAYIMVGVVVGSLLIGGTGRIGDSAASAFIIAAIVATILLGSGMMANHMPALGQFDLRRVQEARDYTARTAGSGVIIDYDLQTPRGFAMSLLLGAANLLLAPFPWQLGGASLRLLLTLPEVVVWWWIVLRGLVPGMTWCLRQRARDAVPLLLFLLAMGTLYSIIFSNIGLGYRYRATLMPWLLIFAMVGVEQRWVRRSIARQVAPFPSSGTARPLIGHFAP